MVDFTTVSVHRGRDRASPSFLSLTDRLRSWWRLRDRRITKGRNITLKQGASISLCNTASLHIGDNALFHTRTWLLLTLPHPSVTIGKWVFVGRDTIIAAKNSITIGDFTIFAPNCYVIDHEHGFAADDLILNQKSVLKQVTIGRDCYFGAGTVVLGGVTIGDGAVLGANSVVTRDIPAYEIWAGAPARFIRKRT